MHLDALHRTALRLCGGREAEAEDLLQVAVVRAYRAFHDLRDQGAARSWLFTILVRTHRNRLRARRRRREILAGDLDEAAFEAALASWRPSPSPERTFGRRRLRERLEAALDSLAPLFREVVWLVDVEGYRQREAAEILDVPEGTVASRLFRARRRLRERLSEGTGTERHEEEAS